MATPVIARRVLLAAVIGALSSACATTRVLSRPAPLRIMTWNIQAGGRGLDDVAATIREMKPDIVGLQEVDVHWSDRSRFADQAADLAAALGMHVSFAPIYRIPNANAALPVRQYGVALLSRFAIVQARNDSLTRLSTQEQNASATLMPGLLEALVDVEGRRVRLFVTHLDYRADPSVRVAQVAEMLRYIGRPDEPTILLGDLNATPAATELQPLFRVLQDTWRAGPGLTYPADKPAKRIDYVLASSHFEIIAATVGSAQASDHRPVLAELRLQRP
jgi:endonuclease/exonuclease/phosphatase family metal-dependent hydrolase